MFKNIKIYFQKKSMVILPGIAAMLGLVVFFWYPVLQPPEKLWAQNMEDFLSFTGWRNIIFAGDKPVFSYLFSALILFPFREISTWVIRIPDIIAAMILLYAVMYIGKSIFRSRAGIISGWLILSSYIFLFAGRSAGGDMFIYASIMIAVAWVLAQWPKRSFSGYFFFYLICFFGVMAKDVQLLAVPLLAVVILLYSRRELMQHLNLKNFAAILIGVAVFTVFKIVSFAPQGMALPELLQKLRAGDIIALSITGSDSAEPFFYYIKAIIPATFPWTILFAVVIFDSWRNYKKNPPEIRGILWLLLCISVIFSAAGGKHWYYMMSVIPFVVILCAEWLCREEREHWQETFINIIYYFVTGAASVGVFALFILPVLAAQSGLELPLILLIAPPVAGIIVLGVALAAESESITHWWHGISMLSERLVVILVGMAILIACIAAFCLPALEPFRTTRDFVKEELVPIVAESDTRIVLLAGNIRKDVIYYLAHKDPVSYFSVWDNNGNVKGESLEKFYQFINMRLAEGVMIISDNESAASLAEFAGEGIAWEIDDPDWREPECKFDTSTNHKIVAWLLKQEI